MKIDSKYKIPLMGEYNSAIYECPECGVNLIDGLYNYTIGFADSPIGLVIITECPHCFKNFYSHANDISYTVFLSTVRKGRNKFYK